jgi:hypothetical protein
VDLGDRSRGKRPLVDRGEDLIAELRLDHRPQRRERHRRHFVHELAELLDVHVRQQVRARREKLPELDVGRSELLEREPELARALRSGRTVADDADLREHAPDAAPARDARDLESALDTLDAGSHARRSFPPSQA